MAVSVWLSRPQRPLRALLLGALAGLALNGCAGPAPKPVAPFDAHLHAGGRVGHCARLYARTDQAIRRARVRDAQAARIAGFPYLRVNRFLASFRTQALRPPAFAAWVERLRALDTQSRTVEIANLPQRAVRRLAPDRPRLERRLQDCAGVLRRHDLAGTHGRALLRERARVPDEYSTLKRVLGLYPLTSILVMRGVARLHRATYTAFAAPVAELPIAGRLVDYAPPAGAHVLAPAEVAAIVRRSADNPLHIPDPRGADRKRLFRSFAPVWQIDVAGGDDRIGAPYWTASDTPAVDTTRPVVYRKLSHVRFDGRILLQLSYVVWFPARPLKSRWDILGGRLDGITWRVTLAPDGRPLIYDAVHNCGCYHMFFPGARLRFQPPPVQHSETPLVPQGAPQLSPGQRIAIRIAHGTHYLQRLRAVSAPPAPRRTYAFADYSALRSLAGHDARRRSLFGPDGIVAGTERAERWLLWPTGVPDPGAMRQWGHHPIAFVGRRHFDDPDLIQRYFAIRP